MSDDYFSNVLGDREGIVCVALGRNPYRNANGRYVHKEWVEIQYRWPAQRDVMVREIDQEVASGGPTDVFVAPAVRHRNAKRRRKGDALSPLVVWVDLDREPADPDLLDRLGPLVVASGSAGHVHAYVMLDKPTDLGTHAALGKALAARLGGDAKWSDETLLRLPGTLNFKPTAPPAGEDPGEPTLVEVASAARRTWTVPDLAAELGVPLTAEGTVTTSTTAGTTIPTVGAEPAPNPLPPFVERAINAHCDDRSAAHARLVGACLDSGLTLGQTFSVVAGYRPSVDKYGPRLSDEVSRFWLKAIDERQRRSHGQNGHNPTTPDSGEDSGRFGHASAGPWDEPMPLGWQPRPLPTDTLGPVLGPLADAIAEAYQVPADLAINLALPLITTAARGRWSIRVTADWTETLALATLSALASGERKSPVMRVLADPLLAHEHDEIEQARARIAEQQAMRKIAEDRAEKLRKDAVKSGTTVDTQMYVDACKDLAELVVDPIPRWLVDDITVEAVALRLAEHGSIGAVSAEPGLFSIMAGRYNSGQPNIEAILKATSGDSITVDRMGRDPIHVASPALHMSMCIQPGRLVELGAAGKAFRGSGLLARLLFVIPEPRVGTRSISPKPIPDDILVTWREHLTKLIAVRVEPDTELVVDPAAREALDDFRTRLEPRLHPHHGNLAGIADWGSKLPGTVVRIAAALTLLADPHQTRIDQATMADAIRLGEAYISHAQAAFATIHAADDHLANARGVLAWLRRNGQPVFSLRDVYRALRGRAWIEKADDLRPVLAVLVDYSHIRPVPTTSGEVGRPSERFELHPTHLIPSAKSAQSAEPHPTTHSADTADIAETSTVQELDVWRRSGRHLGDTA